MIYTVFKYPEGLAEMAEQGVVGEGWISDDKTITIANSVRGIACEHGDHPNKPSWWSGPFPHMSQDEAHEFTNHAEFSARNVGI